MSRREYKHSGFAPAFPYPGIAHIRRQRLPFSRDVAPIFFKNCVGCHRPGEISPMSHLTYKGARPRARSVREKILGRTISGRC
jgi:hypothetical protein